uniref:Uncharacterized protein n=1 Tax=Rhizophora mucronata TaxID=61149 RepID=A0A2P2QS70_RHIMU
MVQQLLRLWVVFSSEDFCRTEVVYGSFGFLSLSYMIKVNIWSNFSSWNKEESRYNTS